MKRRTLYIARTMMNGKAWDLAIFSSKPKMNLMGDMNGMSMLFEGDRLFSFWNLELILPNICPEKGSVYKIEIEEMEDGSYKVRRLEL